MNSLLKDLTESFRKPEFWAYSTWLDIITRYRRLYLGMIWIFMPPVVYIFGLGYMYSAISGRGGNFIAHLGIGWTLWRMTTMAINESSGVYSAHKAFIMDGRVCLTDYLLRALSKALFYFVFAFLVVLVVLIGDPSIPIQNMATLLITLPVFVLNLFWISVVTSLFGTRYPDVREFINTMLLFGFFLTPILWSAQTLPPGSMRGTIARFNPAFHFVEFVRAPVLGNPIEPLSLWVVAVMTLVGWFAAAAVYRRYARFVPLWA